ncbi:transcription factor-like 5 protein [Astyanax mexicanus]|uniref:Transcription factor-like 5 protein n=2 Tax=Astyanax mexicanus TaxID=7994 RepID=A0A8T2LEA5_ASTMX|nr:transcription factor-like 5 protein [Astyanax mexicanus]
MSTSVACKALHVAPPVGQFISDPVGVLVAQNGSGPGAVDSAEFDLMEMTDVEYTHLQHIIQTHMDTPAADQDESVQIQPCKKRMYNLSADTAEVNLSNHQTDCSPPSPPASASCPPNTSSTLPTAEHFTFPDSNHHKPEALQEIQLVLCSNDDGEKTPNTCVEVPNSVLAKAKYAKNHSENPTDHRALPPLQLRPNPPARVCLEKRFTCSHSTDKPRKQEAPAAVINTFLSILHHSTDTHGIALLSQFKNGPKAETAAAVECAHTYGGNFLNSNVQGLGSLLEGSKQPEVILPQNLSLTFRPDNAAELLLKTPYIITAESGEQDTVNQENVSEGKSPVKRAGKHGLRALQEQAPNILHSPGNWKVDGKRSRRTGPPVEFSQRREKHNSKERDRRRRIRLCCDELNLLVPFCSPETDKASTLQWTTAFIKYIREVNGDALRQEFESTFCGKTGVRLKPSSAAAVQEITENRI